MNIAMKWISKLEDRIEDIARGRKDKGIINVRKGHEKEIEI